VPIQNIPSPNMVNRDAINDDRYGKIPINNSKTPTPKPAYNPNNKPIPRYYSLNDEEPIRQLTSEPSISILDGLDSLNVPNANPY